MNALFRLEGQRFFLRRIVRVIAAAGLLAVVVAGPIVFLQSNRDIAAATAHARMQALADREMCLKGEGNPGNTPPGEQSGTESTNCNAIVPGQVTADPRFHLTSLVDVFQSTIALLIVAGLALGATFVGAEWHQRTMTTLLTWEPRRARVALAKLGASASSVFIGALAFQALLGAALVPAAVFRGTTSGVTLHWFGELAGLVFRGAATAGVAAALGGSIALIGRHTAAALGAGFVWFAVLEGMLRGIGGKGIRLWLLGDNAAGFIAGGSEAPRSMLGSGALLSLYAAVLVWAGVEAFRRRDVA